MTVYKVFVFLQVVRVYGFDDGTRHGSKPPIQNPIGTFHEEALQRYDFVMATAGEIGIRLILCMVRKTSCDPKSMCAARLHVHHLTRAIFLSHFAERQMSHAAVV